MQTRCAGVKTHGVLAADVFCKPILKFMGSRAGRQPTRSQGSQDLLLLFLFQQCTMKVTEHLRHFALGPSLHKLVSGCYWASGTLSYRSWSRSGWLSSTTSSPTISCVSDP